ncbi:type II secretion system protein [Pelosinus sp. sgz500959]|uniref:type II secretion system protein n=1 Tax=Pelosinus sp. sgz500959 TaxID=3242472 RepID=UPI003671A629
MLMTLRKKIKNQKGFTLIELLVVISIIGVLASIGVPKFMDTTAAARTAKVQAELGAIDSAIQIYGADHGGTMPAAIGNIDSYMSGGARPTVAAGKYKIGNATPIDVTATTYDMNTNKQAIVTLGTTTYTAASLAAAIAAAQ